MDRPIGEQLRVILEKMFEGTEITYSDDYVKTEGWYLNYEWGTKEKENYTQWLSDYLYSNKEARAEIMSIPTKNKKKCLASAEAFVNFFSWKDKIEQIEPK